MQAFQSGQQTTKNFISQNVSTDVSLKCNIYCNIMMYFKGTPK